MVKLTANWAVGWNAKEQTHNAAMAKRVILGESMAYLMGGGDELTRRFASTVLDAIGFANGAYNPKEASKSETRIASNGMQAKDIDYIHRKFASEIYSKYLAMPLMSDSEFAQYVTEETLRDSGKQEYLDLLAKDIRKELGIRL